MLVKDIMKMIDENFPLSFSYDWDNCGLMVGNLDRGVNKIITCLELTDEVICEAINEGVDLIITHHPLIFSGLKSITNDDLRGSQILMLIEEKISVISLHTNFDIAKGGLNDGFCEKAGFKNFQILDVIGEKDGKFYGMGRYGNLDKPMSLRQLALDLKNKFNLQVISVVGDLDEQISSVAVVTGSGSDYSAKVAEMGIDLLITGDLKYHTAQDSLQEGINIIDCGHFGSEDIFKNLMSEFLNNHGLNSKPTKVNQNPIQYL